MQISSYNLQDSQTHKDLKVKSLQDLDKVDITQLTNIDPERISLGTEVQDAALIAQTYERGSAYTPSEAAVFATLNRHLDNYRSVTKGVSAMLKTYTMVPTDSLSSILATQSKLAKDAKVVIPGGAAGGAGVNTGAAQGQQSTTQAVKINTTDDRHPTDQGYGIKGASLASWAHDCIPCSFKPSTWLQVKPGIDLTNILKVGLQGVLNFLNGIGDLLRNLDVFGDLCSLLDMFNFICIPDMQRILMLLSALLMFEMPSLAGLIGMVQCLIAPLFSGLLSSLMGLLDQFSLLIANPLQCIVDALTKQLGKLPKGQATNPPPLKAGEQPPPPQNNIFKVASNATRAVGGKPSTVKSVQQGEQKVSNFTNTVNSGVKTTMQDANAVAAGVGNSVEILRNFLQNAIMWLKNKIAYYLGDFKALMGEMANTSGGYIGASLKKLQIIRLISFITALVTALASGSNVCSKETMPEKSAINNFYANYLSPTSPFNFKIDDQGQIHLDEKKSSIGLPNAKNVVEFEGRPLVAQVAQNLLQPVMVVKVCRLEVTTEETNTLNQYIAELNQS